MQLAITKAQELLDSIRAEQKSALRESDILKQHVTTLRKDSSDLDIQILRKQKEMENLQSLASQQEESVHRNSAAILELLNKKKNIEDQIPEIEKILKDQKEKTKAYSIEILNIVNEISKLESHRIELIAEIQKESAKFKRLTTE